MGPGVPIGRSSESDAIVIPLLNISSELAELLREFSFPSTDLLAVEPTTFVTEHINIFLVGYPEETSYIDNTNTILSGIVYGSGEHPDEDVMAAARAAEPDRFVSWIADAEENINLVTKENYDVPALNCASGGPWMMVDHEADGPRVRIIAMHSRRRIFHRLLSPITIAYGVPVARHIGITLLSYLR